jgi:hypothetical protein
MLILQLSRCQGFANLFCFGAFWACFGLSMTLVGVGRLVAVQRKNKDSHHCEVVIALKDASLCPWQPIVQFVWPRCLVPLGSPLGIPPPPLRKHAFLMVSI